MTRFVDKALLTRDQDPADARIRRLRPAGAGAALARRAVVLAEEADQGFFGDQAGAAVSVLQRLLPPDDS